MGEREAVIAKKKKIAKDPKRCLRDALFEISRAKSGSNPNEMLEWIVAFSECFDEHPEGWGVVEKADPEFGEFKRKVEQLGHVDWLLRRPSRLRNWNKWATYFLIGLIALFALGGQVTFPTSFEGFLLFLGVWFAATGIFGIPIGIVLRKVWGKWRGGRKTVHR